MRVCSFRIRLRGPITLNLAQSTFYRTEMTFCDRTPPLVRPRRCLRLPRFRSIGHPHPSSARRRCTPRQLAATASRKPPFPHVRSVHDGLERRNPRPSSPAWPCPRRPRPSGPRPASAAALKSPRPPRSEVTAVPVALRPPHLHRAPPELAS